MTPRFLITGAGGMLGQAFAAALPRRFPGCVVDAFSHADLDVADSEAVAALTGQAADWIIHCAAATNADRCERDPGLASSSIVEGTRHVAALAAATGARLLFPQSFLVFDGSASSYAETMRPLPISVYGRAKAEAEALAEGCPSGALVVRMGGFFGGAAADKNFVGKFVHLALQRLAAGDPVIEVGDRVWQPTYTDDLAWNTSELIARESRGVYHMASHGEATFADVATEIVEHLGLAKRLTVCRVAERAVRDAAEAPRPSRVILDNCRLRAEAVDLQRPWRHALRDYLSHPYFEALRRH